MVASEGAAVPSLPIRHDGEHTARRNAAYISPGRSTANHVIVVLTLTLVGLVLGAAAAVVKSPVYKAQSRLVVGKTVDLTNQAAVAGLPSAESQIAANYSRLVGTSTVNQDIVKRLGHPAAGSVTASPVSGSAVILIEATGATQAEASALSVAGSQALVDAVNSVNQQTAAANNALLAQYQSEAQIQEQDQLTVATLQQQQTTLQNQITALTGQTTAGPAKSVAAAQAQLPVVQQQLQGLMPQLAAALARVDTDKVKTSALQAQYAAAYNPNQDINDVVSPLGTTALIGSNRRSNLEIGVIAGIVGGFVVGVAAASLVDIRRGRRRPRSQR